MAFHLQFSFQMFKNVKFVGISDAKLISIMNFYES